MIPFLDLKAQYYSIKDEVDPAVIQVMESTQFVLGAEVEAFEKEFAAYTDADYGIAVNSGTSALHLALLAAGVGPDDEVITVPFTFVATAAAICYIGARPVFVDVDSQSYTMNVNQLEAAITDRTKVILPVHIYGQAADMDPILEIAKKYGLIVVEDAAQAHGATYKGRAVGSIGDLGCFSFYPGKNLGAYGEGGIVVTNNAEYDHKVRILRDWGQERKYHHELLGFNYRMDGFQGAVLRVKLRHLEDWTEARRAHAAHYNRLLASYNIQPPPVLPDRRHVYHIYAIRTTQRERLQKALQEKQIHTGIHYPIPVHMQQGYASLGYKAGDFPCSETIANEVLSLPMFAELTDEQVEIVAKSVNEHFHG